MTSDLRLVFDLTSRHLLLTSSHLVIFQGVQAQVIQVKFIFSSLDHGLFSHILQELLRFFS